MGAGAKILLKIGHRGARAYEPENTLRSFKCAIELGVDAVELDVRKTKDNEIVIINNSEVDKTTDGSGSVSDFALEEIKHFVTEKGEQIPTLEEGLEFVGKRVKILVELKETGIEEKVFGEGYGKGIGIGLHMGKIMCNIYGWTIRETGKPGKGAQFTMTIPKTNLKGKIAYQRY